MTALPVFCSFSIWWGRRHIRKWRENTLFWAIVISPIVVFVLLLEVLVMAGFIYKASIVISPVCALCLIVMALLMVIFYSLLRHLRPE
ncbi:MAG: hypothetical protein CSA35_09525 [Dethiosulfovibrio peptidovorans]|nr:MAG: hypothetical protein CSA35_09525 [Dethiosulfovibrio peptidovorans]